MGKRAHLPSTAPLPPSTEKRVRVTDKGLVPAADPTDPDSLSFEELRSCTAAKIKADPKVDEWLTAWSLLLVNKDETLHARVRDFVTKLFLEPTTITTRRMVLKVPEFTTALLGHAEAPKRLHTRSLSEKEAWLQRHYLVSPQSSSPAARPVTQKETESLGPTPKTDADSTPLPKSTPETESTNFDAMDLWTFLQVFGQWYGITLLERSLTEVLVPGSGMEMSVPLVQLQWIQANGAPLPCPQTMLRKLVASSPCPKAELLCAPLSFDAVESLQDVLFDLRFDPAALRVAATKTFEKYPRLPGPSVYGVDMSTWMYFVCWTLFHGVPLYCTAERQALLATARVTMPPSSTFPVM
jgi:hypothetical protein